MPPFNAFLKFVFDNALGESAKDRGLKIGMNDALSDEQGNIPKHVSLAKSSGGGPTDR